MGASASMSVLENNYKSTQQTQYPITKSKYGPGYSKILNVMQNSQEYEILFPNYPPTTSVTPQLSKDQKRSAYLRTAQKLQRNPITHTPVPKTSTVLGVKLAPISTTEANNNVVSTKKKRLENISSIH